MLTRAMTAKSVSAAAIFAVLAFAAAVSAGESFPSLPGQTPTALIELDGTDSENPDGGELLYEWKQIEGPRVELSDYRAAKPYFRTGKPGLYRFQLVVESNGLKSEPFTVEIVIERENQPPVAKLPAEVRGEMGKPIRIDGSESFDSDGDPITYRWNLPGGGALNIPVELLDKPVLSFTPQQDGVYEVELVVSDGKAASAPVVTTLYVKPPRRPPRAIARAVPKEIPAAPQPIQSMVPADGERPIANIEGPSFAKAGESVMLDARGSKAAGNSRLEYLWRQKSGPFIRNFELIFEGAAERFAPPRAGDYEFELIVSDGRLDSPPAVHRLSVAKETEPPVAVVVAPARAVPGALVKLDASQSYDLEGSQLVFKWRQTGGPRVTRYLIDEKLGDSVPAFHPPAPGRYTFALVVSNGRMDSRQIEVNIDVGDQSRPPGLAIVGPQVARIGEPFTLSARLSDDGGRNFPLAWRQAEGPAKALDAFDGASVNVVLAVPGRYVFEATAMDGPNPAASARQTVEAFAQPPASGPQPMAGTGAGGPMPLLQPLPDMPAVSPPARTAISASAMQPPAVPPGGNRITDIGVPRAAAQIHPSARGGIYPLQDDPVQPIPALPTIP